MLEKRTNTNKDDQKVIELKKLQRFLKALVILIQILYNNNNTFKYQEKI